MFKFTGNYQTFFVNLLEHLTFSLAIQIFLLDLSSY